MNLKERVIELLEDFDKGKYSNVLLNDYFNKNKITAPEKAFITEVFYGVIRNLIFLDYEIEKRTKKVKKSYLKQLLRISFYQLTFMNSETKAVVWEGAELAKKYGDAIGNFINGVLRTYDREKEEELKEIENKSWAIRYSYPEWFVAKVKANFGKRSLEILKLLKEIPYLSVRINKLKYSEKEFLKFVEREKITIVNKVEDVYYISKTVINTPEFLDGKFIIQDGSSYITAKNLGALSGEKILDACSAPGSKALVLAAEMENIGEIIALDIHDHKIELINENAKKMGINIIKTENRDATKIHQSNDTFDRILVDAPCTGFGVLRKKPEALYNKTQDTINELAILQYDILTSASKKLKTGGILLYSTCTIFSEENIENVKRFLKENKNFETVEVTLPENVGFIEDEIKGKTIIDKYLDGFYIVKMKRNN